MRLQRVQIPNFRVLKDIDITFEDYHIPQIFPLASQNGGGKSTFLQLVFTLLTCCYGNRNNELVENLFKNIEVKTLSVNDKFSTIMLVDRGNSIALDFYLHNNSSLSDKFLQKLSDKDLLDMYDGIGGCDELIEDYKNEIEKNQEEINLLEDDEKYLSRLWERKGIEPSPLSMHHLSELSMLCSKLIIDNNNLSAEDILSELRREIRKRHLKSEHPKKELQRVIDLLLKVDELLLSDGIQTIYCKNDLNLVCKVTCQENFDYDSTKDLLKRISSNVFIAASDSQVFLFLSPEELSALFQDTSNYSKILSEKQGIINNLFLYEFSIIKILTNAFGKALENDKIQAIRSGGGYGNEFRKLLNDLKDFLSGKVIQPSEDMSKIVIKQRDNNNQEVNLGLSDLSHGELRRLSFYAWLKTNKIKDSIVLIDEIEIGLHPDWQYQIVRDLEEWEPSNQYILATHSYDVCSALSPSHVKEIEPKLLKSDMKAAQ